MRWPLALARYRARCCNHRQSVGCRISDSDDHGFRRQSAAFNGLVPFNWHRVQLFVDRVEAGSLFRLLLQRSAVDSNRRRPSLAAVYLELRKEQCHVRNKDNLLEQDAPLDQREISGSPHIVAVANWKRLDRVMTEISHQFRLRTTGTQHSYDIALIAIGSVFPPTICIM